MSKRYDVRIPYGSDLRKILEELIYELWVAGKLDTAAVNRIKDAGHVTD
jgi:hypothetical protein